MTTQPQHPTPLTSTEGLRYLVPYFPENWCQNFRNPQGQRAAQGNRNTELKAKIFDEALERLQKRLAVLEEKSAE
jgi:hypothetical protein